MSDWQIVAWVLLCAWIMFLTLEVSRLSGLVDRLDKVLSDALTALGFPKKSGSGGDNRP